MRDMCQMPLSVGKPYVKTTEFQSDSVLIMIGVTGEIRGQVVLALTTEGACKIAGKMMMMEVKELDEISTSAISELGNMVMGNAATILSTKGIGIDITPPTLCRGQVSISTSFTKNVCIPLLYEGQTLIELDIAVKSDD
jgi:chemotaxis protein CheX